MNGGRSQLMIGRSFTSCVISAVDGREYLEQGLEVMVSIRLQFPEYFEGEFDALKDARLYEGSKLVGLGTFIDESA